MREKSYWHKTPWATDDLEDKRVEFQLIDRKRRQVTGVGKFRVRERPSGEQYVEIVVTQLRSETELVDHIFKLTPFHTARIERHADPKVAEFRCMA